MSATVQINGIDATITDYQWKSKNKKLEKVLNAMLDPHGPSGADPNPELTAAQAAVDQLGGKLMQFDTDDTDPGTIH